MDYFLNPLLSPRVSSSEYRHLQDANVCLSLVFCDYIRVIKNLKKRNSYLQCQQLESNPYASKESGTLC